MDEETSSLSSGSRLSVIRDKRVGTEVDPYMPWEYPWCREKQMNFNELLRLLEKDGFRIVKEKGSIRYYGKPGCPRLIRVDYHGLKEVPTGTCHSILKAAGLK